MNLKQHLHLPHFHLCRCQRTSGEGVENGITAPTLVDDVTNDPGTLEPTPDPAKTYRILPIFSGLMIPFSIMLSIPSLTGQWYIRTEDNVTTEIRPNPILLNVAMGFSMACAVLANAFLVIRFAERSVKLMTLASIGFLTLQGSWLHIAVLMYTLIYNYVLRYTDLISIAAVTVFGVIHRFDDGFMYGPSFWFTVCSTIVSTATNITLIVDYVNTKDFAHSGEFFVTVLFWYLFIRLSGSGLTHKQRSLVIIVIILLSYISFGALIQAKLLNITFLNALYFSVVTIETVGNSDLIISNLWYFVYGHLHRLWRYISCHDASKDFHLFLHYGWCHKHRTHSCTCTRCYSRVFGCRIQTAHTCPAIRASSPKQVACSSSLALTRTKSPHMGPLQTLGREHSRRTLV